MSEDLRGTFFKEPVNSREILAFLAKRGLFDGEEERPGNLMLEGVCDSRRGGHRQLVFTNNEVLGKNWPITSSLVLIDEIPQETGEDSNQYCKVSDPRAAFIDVLEWLISTVGLDAHWRGFDRESSISPNAEVSKTAVIESAVEIGAGSVICSGAVIKKGTRIGENTVVRENVVIGSDGVTVYRANDGRLLKFPHVAGVFIGSNTEIGSNTVVAGGILAPTFIGSDVVIGNLCNVGHGANLQDGVWMSVGSLIGGHTTIHAGATIAMGVTVRDNLVIGEAASLGMGSVVVRNVDKQHSMFGNPAKRMVGLRTGPKR